jgi:hypothetical protein
MIKTYHIYGRRGVQGTTKKNSEWMSDFPVLPAPWAIVTQDSDQWYVNIVLQQKVHTVTDC